MKHKIRNQAWYFENTQTKGGFYHTRRKPGCVRAVSKAERALFWLFVAVYSLLFPYHSFSETVDRIVAVVNEQIITLTDLRIVEEFGLYDYDKEAKKNVQDFRQFILEELIDQKLVIQFAREQVSVEKEEVDSFLKKITEKMGYENVQKKLEEFGMDWDDLKAYIEEKIIYQKVISVKFTQGNIVSLKEIEDYYNLVYVPSQKEKGLEPQLMMDILSEIESSLKQEKIRTHVEGWINTLKKRADIQINRE